MIGKVEQIEAPINGYECNIMIFFSDLNQSLLCYGFSLKEIPYNLYVNSIEVLSYGSEEVTEIKVGELYNFALSIIFVCEVKVIKTNYKPLIKQFFNNTHETLFIGRINQIEDYVLYCSIGQLGENIPVELEVNIKNLAVGDEIEFVGEIKAEVKNC